MRRLTFNRLLGALAVRCVLKPWAIVGISLVQLFLLQAHANESSAIIKIKLPTQVQVRYRPVLLGEVASLTAYDVTTLSRLMAVSLGQAPRPGHSIILDKAELGRWIRVRTGLNENQITWLGSDAIEVSTQSQEISGEKISQIAEQALRNRLAAQLQQGARIELQVSTSALDMVVPEDKIELKVRSLDKLTITPRMTVWIDAVLSGRVLRTVPVVFDVGVFAPVLVAKRDMPTGIMLATEDIVERERNIVGLTIAQRDPFQVDSKIKRVRRPLRAGEVVTDSHTELTPTVVRGSWALLESRQPGLTLQNRAEVLQDGQIGQLVRVKPLNSSVALMARVIGPGHLEVIP